MQLDAKSGHSIGKFIHPNADDSLAGLIVGTAPNVKDSNVYIVHIVPIAPRIWKDILAGVRRPAISVWQP